MMTDICPACGHQLRRYRITWVRQVRRAAPFFNGPAVEGIYRYNREEALALAKDLHQQGCAQIHIATERLT